MSNINPNKISQEIDSLIAYLIGQAICDDQNFSASRDYGSTVEVTFANAEHISVAYSDIAYHEIYQELANKRSFTMRLIDGALLQLMYSFKGKKLQQHRLAFYPSPKLLPYPEVPESYDNDEVFLDIVQRRIVPFPIRFDFDARENIYQDVTHPKSHLTLGDVKNCRIPVTAPLTPRWFVEFILRNFYQTEENDFLGKLPKHKIKFSETISCNEKSLIHLSVPY